MEATKPKNESARLEALFEHEILDTLPEQVYDDITFLASHICGMPISAISLIDKHRQWFKSIVGLDAKETPRLVAFCAHTILESKTLVINDATKDIRFVDNKLVTEAPSIRFYAGAPIFSGDGHPLGTLCVIDQKPNTLDATQTLALEALARQISVLLQMRLIGIRARKALAHQTVLLEKEMLVDNTTAGIVAVKHKLITRCTPYFEDMLGYAPSQLLGQNIQVVYATNEENEALSSALSEKLLQGDITPIDVMLKRKDGTIFSGYVSGYTLNSENPLDECILTFFSIR